MTLPISWVLLAVATLGILFWCWCSWYRERHYVKGLEQGHLVAEEYWGPRFARELKERCQEENKVTALTDQLNELKPFMADALARNPQLFQKLAEQAKQHSTAPPRH